MFLSTKLSRTSGKLTIGTYREGLNVKIVLFIHPHTLAASPVRELPLINHFSNITGKSLAGCSTLMYSHASDVLITAFAFASHADLYGRSWALSSQLS